jgi:hypothetical protein
MKIYFVLTLLIGGLQCLSTSAIAAPKCSLKTLKGTYLYSANGTKDGIPYAESGQEYYDGNGKVNSTYTDNTGYTGKSGGVYTLGENCIGVAHYISGESFAMYVDPKGSEFSWIAESRKYNYALTGFEKRVTTTELK